MDKEIIIQAMKDAVSNISTTLKRYDLSPQEVRHLAVALGILYDKAVAEEVGIGKLWERLSDHGK